MLRWEHRPLEVANHLNPAFCSLLLSEAVSGYLARAGQGMDYVLCYLILPIVLHKPTREALPRSIHTKLHVWIQDNPSSRIGLGRRAQYLKPYTREALIFGLQQELLVVNEAGLLITVQKKIPKLPAPEGSEPKEIQKRASFLGKWFADAGNATTLLTMWGLRP